MPQEAPRMSREGEVCQGGRGRERSCGQGSLLWFPRISTGEAGQADLALASLIFSLGPGTLVLWYRALGLIKAAV